MFMRTHSKFKRDGTDLCRGPQGARCMAGGPRCAGGGTRCIQREETPRAAGNAMQRATEDRRGTRCIQRGANTRMRWTEWVSGKRSRRKARCAWGRQGRGRDPEPATKSPAKRKERGLCPKESAKHPARRRGGPADDGDMLPQ